MSLLERIREFCICPDCRAELTVNEDCESLFCSKCQREFRIEKDVVMLLPKSALTDNRTYIECYERMAMDSQLREIVDRRTMIQYHQDLLEFIGNTKGKRILDVGSGEAFYLRRLEGSIKVALDISFARLNHIPVQYDILKLCADAEALPVKAGFFDVIILADILEHVLNVEKVVERIKEIAHDQTRIIVHVPWEEDLSVYYTEKYRIKFPYKFTHLRSFDSAKIYTLFSGLKLYKKRSSFPRCTTPIFLGRIEAFLPPSLINLFLKIYSIPKISAWELQMRSKWIEELPKRKWLLAFYKPTFRMFEFRKK